MSVDIAGTRWRVVVKSARLAALTLLVVSYAAFLCQEFPIPSSQGDLLRALKSDKPPAVEVSYDIPEYEGVSLFWATSPLTYRELRMYAPDSLPGGPEVNAVEKEIAAKAGVRAEDISFRSPPTDAEPGFLTFFIPATYPLYLRFVALRWVAFCVGAAVLLTTCAAPRRFMRVKSRGLWPAICLITGVGFFTCLWLERGVAPGGGEAPPLSARCAWAASLATAAVMVLAGWGLVHVMRWMG
ncbi:hypothetical protein [Streptomyces sp. NPDC046985]|uniref:hypothetical protein n=1 Tax=Streptomyces sp. NPDC046985 TaxID=3155377 RepID=UPI003405D6F5